MGGHSQFFLQCQLIHLDDESIYFVGQIIPFFFKLLAEIDHALNAMKYFFLMNRASETQVPQHFKALCMGRDFLVFRGKIQVGNMVNKGLEVSFAHQPCVFQSQ